MQVRDRIVTLIETVAKATNEMEFQRAYRKAVRLLKQQEQLGSRKRMLEEDLLQAGINSATKISRRRGYQWAG